MIIDTIQNAAKYYEVSPLIEAGLRFLAIHDLTNIEIGRYDILGDDCYALVSEYITEPREARRWEAHRNHIDIQYIVSGHELIGVTPTSTLTSVEYNTDKDNEFFGDSDGEFVTLESGSFVILYPEDAHMPCVVVGEGVKVRKVVVKVLLQ